MKLLEKQWSNWNIQYAEKEMYVIEKKMGLDYTRNQITHFENLDLEKIRLDEADEEDKLMDFDLGVAIIKRGDSYKLIRFYNMYAYEVAILGEGILDVLDSKPFYLLKKEVEMEQSHIFLVDLDAKKIWVNETTLVFEEELQNAWPGWIAEVGNFGYINLLEKSGMDTSSLKMNQSEVEETLRQVYAD